MKKVLMASFALVLLLEGFAFAAYIDNGNGTVTDTTTGLMWQQETPSARNWQAALDYAETLALAGYDDWRLPNSNELQSIVDYGRYNPSIDAAAFPGTVSSNYWSSTATAYNGTLAWCIGFDKGGIGDSGKTNSYAVRAVRGGQSRSSGSLVISAPAQAARFPIGISQTILWDAAGISGNVKITLSRQGGKPGTFTETIAESAPNSGSYTCTVQGPETVNGALRIEPLLDPSRSATQSLFAITTLLTIGMTVEKLGDPGHFKVTLTGRYNDGALPLAATFASSDASVATINAEGFLTALKNGYVEVSTNYNGITYKKGLFVYTTLSALETEQNDTKEVADMMVVSTADASLSKFYKGTLTEGDTDWFKFTLPLGTLVNLGYLCQSATADTRMDLYDAADVLMASDASADGSPLILSVGLPAGDYYLHLTPTGDIDATGNYVIAYKIPGSFPAKSAIPIVFGGTATGTIGSLADKQEMTFTLATERAIRILFAPSSATARYRLTLLNGSQTVIDRIDCLDQKPVSFQAIYGAGSYTLVVTPRDVVDAQNPFAVSLASLDGQWEKEPNDTPPQATLFDLTRPLNGRLSSETDLDFFSFGLDAPRFLALVFSAPESTGNYTLTLFKESGDYEIDGFDIANAQTTTHNMGLGAGRYYLRVRGGATNIDTIHNYTLTFQDCPQTNLEIESNNTLKFANAIDQAQAKQGRIYSAQDRDYYGFHLAEDGVISLTFTPTTSTGDYRVSLVDENDEKTGTPLYAYTSTNGETISAAELYIETSGNYYIKVEPNGDIDPVKPYALAIAPLTPAAIVGLKQLVNLAVMGAAPTMTVNGTQTLTAVAGYSDASAITVTPVWTSLNPGVATVNAAGLVTAVAQGTTSIVASYGGLAGRFDLRVGASANAISQHYGNLILVGGGGYQSTNTLRASTLYLTDLVYRRFKERLFNDEDIYFLHPWPSHDLNGDGFPENIIRDTVPTVAKLGLAITQWAASRSTDGPLYLYLVDHGGQDTFVLYEDANHIQEILTAAQLKAFIDAFQTATGRRVIVIIEAGKSGSFVNGLAASGPNRIVVTSTNDQYPFMSPSGTDSFTQFFMDKLREGGSLWAAFQTATQNLAGMGWPYNQQIPQLSDALAAQNVRIGGDFPITIAIPSFIGQSASKSFTANVAQTLFASFAPAVRDQIASVWAVVVPPVYDVSAAQILQFPTVDLSDPQKDGRYEGSYGDFAYNGEYRIVFHAKTTGGSVIVSAPTVFTVTGGLDVKSIQVVKAGAGRGTVAGQPAGIDCGGICRKFYDVDTGVVLTAGAETGSAFTGWSGGGCTGTGTCSIAVNGAKSVTATFIDVYGDIDGNGAATLTDAILALKITAGVAPAGSVSLGADVNHDGRIGLPEAIYIMQRVSGIR